jgi:hypothetical protein
VENRKWKNVYETSDLFAKTYHKQASKATTKSLKLAREKHEKKNI